ncbi:MAG: radical SAM protein [Bacteroidota bacterium]
MKLTPDTENKKNPSNPFWDNTDLLAKILYRWNSHGILFVKAVKKRASLRNLLITRFPFRFKDSLVPPSLHIEFTNSCNLKCVYCNNPHFEHPRNIMSDEVFKQMVDHLKKSSIDRICIGGGEATIHPKFKEFTLELAKHSRILTIVSNGQWKDESIIKTLLIAPIDFIEVSVEAGSKEDYEQMRVGGSYDLLIKNLLLLKKLRKELKSKSHINLRLMVRPSQRGKIEKESFDFWKAYGDSIMPQYVLKTEGVDTISDVFLPKQMSLDAFPKCSLPFRNIQIRSNGDIPICQISGSALNPAKKLIAGNILNHSMLEIWQNETFKNYREGHRFDKHELIPICKGCKGC